MNASVVSAIVAVAALLFSLFVYFKHERELKRLSVLTSRLSLQKAIREEEDTSARVTAKIVREKGNNHIAITNEGKVPAQNVQVKLDPEICSRPREYPFPRDVVEPGQTIQISAYLGISGPSTVAVKIWWEDACHLGKPYFKEFNLPIFS